MNYQFSSAQQALDFTANIMRKKAFAQISSAYKFIEKDMAEMTEEPVNGAYSNLPKSLEDKYDLALDMDKLMRKLPDECFMLLKMKHWGDFYTDHQLKKAFSEQEILRRRGIRVRISYKYSNRQLGVLLECCHKTVQRKLNKAYISFEQLLEKEGYFNNDELLKTA